MHDLVEQLEPTCDTAIVMGFTRAWVGAAAVVLHALNDVEPQPFDTVLMVQDLPESQRELLDTIRPCQFIAYEPDLKNSERFARVSSMAFSRYECWAMLAKYKRVLWIDADTLPVGEVLSCFDYVKDTGMGLIPHTGTPISVSFEKDVPGFDMHRECFNSGYIAMTRVIGDYHAHRDWLHEATTTWSDYVNSDQAVINLLFQATNLPPTALPHKYNCSPETPVEDVRVLHPWGNQKFWDGLSDPRWDAYHDRWVAMGGEAAPEPKPRPQVQPVGPLRRGLQAIRRLCAA
ncbi:MAG: glycosyltransferase [Planctomycetota bacterium]